MDHAVSIISFLQYFVLGIAAFVVLLQLLFASRRLRLFAVIRRWFRGPVKPIFIEVYSAPSQSPAKRRNP